MMCTSVANSLVVPRARTSCILPRFASMVVFVCRFQLCSRRRQPWRAVNQIPCVLGRMPRLSGSLLLPVQLLLQLAQTQPARSLSTLPSTPRRELLHLGAAGVAAVCHAGNALAWCGGAIPSWAYFLNWDERTVKYASNLDESGGGSGVEIPCRVVGDAEREKKGGVSPVWRTAAHRRPHCCSRRRPRSQHTYSGWHRLVLRVPATLTVGAACGLARGGL